MAASCTTAPSARATPLSPKRLPTYHADAIAELHVWLDGGGWTILGVTLRWKKFGTECWLNLRANPTTLLIGTNVFAADTGLDLDRERLCRYRHPFLLFERLLRAVDPAFRWSNATAGRIERGDLELKNVQLAYYLPFKDRAGLRRFLHWLRAVFCTPIVTKTWSSFELGKYLRLRVETKLDARGRPTGVMIRAYRNAARNADVTTNFYDKAATLKKAGRAALGEPRREWLERHLRTDVTLHPLRSAACSPPRAWRANRAPSPPGAARWRSSTARRTASADG